MQKQKQKQKEAWLGRGCEGREAKNTSLATLSFRCSCLPLDCLPIMCRRRRRRLGQYRISPEEQRENDGEEEGNPDIARDSGQKHAAAVKSDNIRAAAAAQHQSQKVTLLLPSLARSPPLLSDVSFSSSPISSLSHARKSTSTVQQKTRPLLLRISDVITEKGKIQESNTEQSQLVHVNRVREQRTTTTHQKHRGGSYSW